MFLSPVFVLLILFSNAGPPLYSFEMSCLLQKTFQSSVLDLMICFSLPVSVSPSSSAFLSTFPEEHSLEHKESQTNQSDHRGKELWPSRRSQVQGQGSGKIMGVEWAEISYLRGQEHVCGVYVCACVYIYLASAFTPVVTRTNTHQTAQGIARWRADSYDSAAWMLVPYIQ